MPRHPSITAGAATASTVHALYALVLLELVMWDPANTGAVEVGFLGLNAAGAAELLVTGLLPFRNEIGVGVTILQEPVVQLLADGLFRVV